MPKRRKRSSGNAFYFVIGSTLIVFVLTTIAAIFYLSFSRPPAACVGTPTGAVEILVDVSDPIPAVTQSQIEQMILNEISDNQDKGFLVELRSLTPNNLSGDLIFSNCHPGNGQEVSSLDGAPERATKKWNELFLQPLSTELKRALGRIDKSDSSPILETLQAISVEAFLSKTGPNKLYIVSDLLQNSKAASFYKEGVQRYFAISQQPIWPEVKPLLDNVTVEYLVLGRQPSKFNSADIRHFWCISWEAAAKHQQPTLGENCPGWHDLVGLGGYNG